MHRFSFVSSHHNLRLHKNLLHSASSYSFSEPFCSRTTAPNNFIEHTSIQKGGVQCTVGAGNIGSLLSATWYSVYFSSSKRDLFIRSPCSSLDSDFSLLELILKPFTVLLEDHRSKASCKSNIKASLLLIELVFFAFQPVIPPWKTCFQGEILPCWYRTIFNCKYIVLQAYLTEFKGISPSCFFRDKYIILGIEVQKCCQLNYLVAWGVNIPRELNLRIES